MWYGAIGLVVAGLLGYALWEPYRLKVTQHRVVIPDLADEFDGFTILQLSDIHGRVGVFSWRVFLGWLAQADLVAVTGDLYSPTLPRARLARQLSQLHAPSGVFFVSGNHDYRRGALHIEPWDVGEELLDNRVARIERKGGRLLIAGIPDLVKGSPQWADLLHTLRATPGPAILLSHRPDAWLLEGIERVSLILSGHTHGGQVRIPGLGALFRHNHLPSRYVAGRLDRPGHPVLITSQGLGTSEMPVRFLTRPEVIVVRLGTGRAATVRS